MNFPVIRMSKGAVIDAIGHLAVEFFTIRTAVELASHSEIAHFCLFQLCSISFPGIPVCTEIHTDVHIYIHTQIRRHLGSFVSSSTTRMRNWAFPSCILVRSSHFNPALCRSKSRRRGRHGRERPAKNGRNSFCLFQSTRPYGRLTP